MFVLLKTKDTYEMLNTYSEEAFCIKHWERQNILGNDWSSIFLLKLNINVNKIGHFQYNLLYNLICCKKNYVYMAAKPLRLVYFLQLFR